jgi:hypothetical protein
MPSQFLRALAACLVLRYGRETLETVLGEHIDTTLGNPRALQKEGTEVWLKILRWREGGWQDTQHPCKVNSYVGIDKNRLHWQQRTHAFGLLVNSFMTLR